VTLFNTGVETFAHGGGLGGSVVHMSQSSLVEVGALVGLGGSVVHMSQSFGGSVVHMSQSSLVEVGALVGLGGSVVHMSQSSRASGEQISQSSRASGEQMPQPLLVEVRLVSIVDSSAVRTALGEPLT
jgi:hypothetical protein